jgi:hypothetical protein
MLIPGIKEALKQIAPISLNEMDKVRLMNRIDLKYVLSVYRIEDLIAGLNGNYRILEINGERLFSYCTTYLDTADFYFFNQHVRGMLDRNKVRYRTYEATSSSFLEIKRTTNKNRTIKWRIKNSIPADSVYDEKATEFINKYVPHFSSLLKPVLINRFKRITLVGSEMNERVTIDFDLSFSKPYGSFTEIPHIAIVELKKERSSERTPMTKILKDFSVRPTGFSKYCFGNSILYDLPHMNLLKSKHLLIKRIENEYCTNSCA